MELYRAIEDNKSIDHIKELIKTGVDVNVGCFHITPLRYAIDLDCDTDVIKLLIKSGCVLYTLNTDNETYDIEGYSSVWYALEELSDPKTIIALLEVGEYIGYGYNGLTPLVYAIDLGYDVSVIKAFIKAGADVNEESYYGTPLFFAIKYNKSSEVIKTLIDGGADVNLMYAGKTPLFISCTYTKNLCIIKLLIEAGADINAVCYGKTPIDVAKEYKRKDVLEILENYKNIQYMSNN